jgi:hypothetical protein
MPSLPDTQAGFRTALLGGDEASARRAVHGDGVTPGARLAIYRHHVVSTLTGVLADTFPVVCRLVDARFFAWAATQYLRAEPPAGPCLFEYGATFPDFLSAFRPCRHLAYLPDVARFEWAMHVAFHAGDVPPLAPAALAAVPERAAARLRLRMHPSVTHLRSSWPIDRIWEAHQTDGRLDRLRVEPADVHLEVWRTTADEVVFRRHMRATAEFRRTLAAGRCLGEAAAVATAADPAFGLPAALAALLDDAVVVGFGIQAVKGDHA